MGEMLTGGMYILSATERAFETVAFNVSKMEK